MSEYRLTINKLEATVRIEQGMETVRATGFLVDEDARIVTEAVPTRFSAFCDAEIVRNVAGCMMVTRRGIEWDDIDMSVELLDLECHCD